MCCLLINTKQCIYLIREDASTAARGGDILRQFSSFVLELAIAPEVEFARGLVMPLLPPFRSTSDRHLPAPYGSSIEQLNESPKRPVKYNYNLNTSTTCNVINVINPVILLLF